MSKSFNSGFNSLAVFSDETENYRFPSSPKKGQKVTIKIRTAENDVDNVCVITDKKIIKMKKTQNTNGFDFYICHLEYYANTVKYYFEISRGTKTFYYSKLGLSENIIRQADFLIIYDFDIPDWANGAVMYQIYIDRFCDGDKTNNVKTNEYIYLGKPVIYKNDWNEFPSAEDIRNFYGGDLQGVINKIPYLKSLGIEAIYFNPVFVSPSNHKYDTQDYEHIDPHIGKIVKDTGRILIRGERSNKKAYNYIIRTTDKKNLEESDKLFAKLIQKAHNNGIKVILDGVFNHCGAFNKWLDREGIYVNNQNDIGAFYSDKSRYADYFIWRDKNGWPNNSSYDSWWGLDNHPKLNYEGSKELMNDIMGVAKKWLKSPYCADGWRIDVGADLGLSAEFNHYFWKMFRKTVKEANPNAVILAEHYGDASYWLNGSEWDTVMNYDAFMEPVSYFFTGMEKHSDHFSRDLYNNSTAFVNSMTQNMAKLPYQSLFTAMNQISNHDHSRFLTRTNMCEGRVLSSGSQSAAEGIDKNIFKEAVLFQMTWPGAPTVYYGDEAGVVGWTDPDNRRTYPWGKEDKELIKFHQYVINIRKKYQVLKYGSVMFLNEEVGVITYARFDQKSVMLTAFNNNKFDIEFDIPVWRCAVLNKCVFRTIFNTKDYSDNEFYLTENGSIHVDLKNRSGVLLYYGI